MGDFTPIGHIDAGVAVQPAIGDVWCDKRFIARTAEGRVHVTDVVPFPKKNEAPPPVTRVCLEAADGSRQWMEIADFRARFMFRRRA